MKQIAVIILLLSLLSNFTFAQTKLSAEILKRIEDNTPKTLPQTPVAPKLKSDAEDDNLKGKVKKLVKERQYFLEDGKLGERKFALISDFNEKGNLLKEIAFNGGNPFQVTVYGYIDGARVSDYETIYEGNNILTQANPQTEEDKNKPKPDPRYSYKYEYKYANDKLAEVQMFYSDGDKGNRIGYTYDGSRVEKLYYDENNKPNRKYVSVFDAKGYEIEWTDIAVINLPRGDRKYIIKNQLFDKKGNWIKRTFFKPEIENGKEILKPYDVEYRTITYY